MSTEQENPYKVLGVERTADERSIKKAYVGLIRKFSPETHPEEFKKIRAAYECLSDADARKRFDDSEKGYDEYGEELSRRLAEVDEATAQKKNDLAREILIELDQRFPEVVVVKEKLGFACLAEGAFKEALEAFDANARKEPENARHQLHRAFALARLEAHGDTERALVKANALDPKDVRVALALVDFYIGKDRIAEAASAVDAIVSRLEPGTPPVVVLLLRKVEAFAMAGNEPRLHAVIDELVRIDEKTKDPELGPFVAAQLAQVAARLFAMRRPGAANALLERCATFNPSSNVERPMPVEVQVAPDALPSDFRDWLEKVAADKTSRLTLRHNTWLMPSLALLVSVGALFFVVMLAATPDGAWGGGEAMATFVFIAAAVGGVVATGRWILQILASPLRTMTTLHPLYLIRATPMAVRLYPLFALADARGVHQHTNGVYTGTNLTLVLGDDRTGTRTVSLSIRGKDHAQAWLDALLGIRGRSLELLAEGCLDAEHMVEQLPPGALGQLPQKIGGVRALWKPLAFGAVVAALGTPVLWYSAKNAYEERVFATAVSDDTPIAWRRFIAENPKSKHLVLAKAQLAASFDQLVQQYSVDPTDPREVAMTKAIAYARDHDGGLSVDVELQGDAFGDGQAVTVATRDHMRRALFASGLGPLVAMSKDQQGGSRLLITLTPAATATLVAMKPPPPKPKANVGGLVGGVVSNQPPPKPVTVSGAEVVVRLEVPGEPPFERKVTVAPPERLYLGDGEKAANVARAKTVALALDAATRSLGLRGPAADMTRRVP